MISGDLLNLPSLPTLKWDGYFWVSPIKLISWAGFQSRQGRYNSIDKPTASDDSVKLIIHTPDAEPCTPSAEQVAAYQHLIAEQDYIRESILRAILARFPTWREEYEEDYSAQEVDEVMPPIQTPEELKKVIGLGMVHIHTVSKHGLAYIGYEFGCDWEEEHGLGAMTHKGRIVDIGAADTAILEWIASEDAEKSEGI
jgi:hypothetical protein